MSDFVSAARHHQPHPVTVLLHHLGVGHLCFSLHLRSIVPNSLITPNLPITPNLVVFVINTSKVLPKVNHLIVEGLQSDALVKANGGGVVDVDQTVIGVDVGQLPQF